MSINSSIANNANDNELSFPSTIPAKIDPPIANGKKFASYSDLEQQMFYALRQGMLTMMPLIAADGTISTDTTGTYEALAIQQCEMFAATVVDNWPTALKIIQKDYSDEQGGVGNANGTTNNTGN